MNNIIISSRGPAPPFHTFAIFLDSKFLFMVTGAYHESGLYSLPLNGCNCFFNYYCKQCSEMSALCRLAYLLDFGSG